MLLWVALAVGAAGIATTIALGAAVGMDRATTLRLTGLVAVSVLVVGAAGAFTMFALRRRSIATQTAVVAVASIGAVAVGAAVAAEEMFITPHDLATLAVILAAATTVGILIVLAYGWQAGVAARSLRDAARRIGEGDLRTPVARPPTAEFAQIGDELTAMTARIDAAITHERAADRSRRELITWISHDLRTPLAAIRAVAEALEDDLIEDPEEVARYHRALRTEADRLADLVDDLFELSRINSGTLRLDLQPVSLTDLVSDSLAAASIVASAKQVRLDGTMSGEATDLLASTPEVTRALSNVLDNAIRHTPPGGTVSVEAGVDDGTAYVAVEDGCGGIPPGDLDRVFEPAFRGEPARTPREEGAGGAGLGLAIARGIVRAHRGDISVSNVGPGCRFIVRLPSRSSADA